MWTVSAGVCFGVVAHLNAQQWPRFRGVDGAGIAQASHLPVTWSDTENLLWKRELPGYGASTPIVTGEKMLLTYYDGYGIDPKDTERDALREHVLCVELDTGRTLWDQAITPNDAERKYAGFIQEHGFASASPVTDGVAVFAFFGSSGVVAYTLDGEKLWGPVSVGTGTHGFGTGSSPILFEDLVIINASVESNSLIALAKRTGERVWKTDDIRRAWNTPLVVTANAEPELVVAMKDYFVGYNPYDGSELWRADGIEDYICPSVIEHDGVIYGIGGRKSACVAVKTGGRGKVEPLWKTMKGSNVPSPVYSNGHLYWVNHTGRAYALDAASGELITEKRLPHAGKTYASVTLADDKLHTVTRDGGAFVLSATPEMKVLAHNKFESDPTVFNASPVIVNNRIYLRSDKALYCIGFE